MNRWVNWCVPMLFCLLPSQFAMAAWGDWWQTPEQRAAHAFENGDHETLVDDAPDAGWKALGHYQAGDYATASASFAERAEQLQQDGRITAANRARYNQGVSDVRAGRYQEAISLFDSVLQSEPGHADAAHNRAIAEKLVELQKQQGDSQQQGSDQQAEQSAEQSAEQAGDQQDTQSEQQGGEQAADQDAAPVGQPGDESSDTRSDRESGAPDESADAGQDASQAADESSLTGRSEAEEQAAAEQARKALAAEAAREDGASTDGTENASPGQGRSAERPLSESEQATEQLLRRIPDDPAGLLRRKLEQSHLNEYPEVRDAPESW
ncbi:MAG: hypothetical protein HKN42_15865 [Granulosicoccus sp.]|nr:hypothetical protein [Granulosicoccus sp.]